MTPRTAAPRLRRTLLALSLAGVLTACGGGDGDSGDDTAAEASPSALSCPIEAEEVPAAAGATTDLATKPVVAPGTAPAPTELQYADIDPNIRAHGRDGIPRGGAGGYGGAGTK